MKTVVYIDGFNLYYGIRHSEYKWLDLVKFMQMELGEEYQIDEINYFTARVKPLQNNPDAPLRQDAYIRALQELYPDKIKIYYGYFLKDKRYMPRADNPNENVGVIKTEEKGSDVNLSVHFLNDAWLNHYECGVMVTNDSDMAEAMKLVKEQFPDKRLVLIAPVILSEKERKVSKKLRQYVYPSFVRTLKEHYLEDAQMPDNIPNSNIYKPRGW